MPPIDTFKIQNKIEITCMNVKNGRSLGYLTNHPGSNNFFLYRALDTLKANIFFAHVGWCQPILCYLYNVSRLVRPPCLWLGALSRPPTGGQDTWHMTHDTWYMKHETWHMTHDIWHMTHDTWHMTHDTWHMTHDTWRMTHDTWHMTHDTWHMTHDTWHMTHDTWHTGGEPSLWSSSRQWGLHTQHPAWNLGPQSSALGYLMVIVYDYVMVM